jgi:hypothetical protein
MNSFERKIKCVEENLEELLSIRFHPEKISEFNYVHNDRCIENMMQEKNDG